MAAVVKHTYTAEGVTTANPAVSVTDAPAAGDILVALIGTGSAVAVTGISGCGATWTRVPGALGANNILDAWIGVGASSSGTVTTTATAQAAGRSVAVHMVSGVSAAAVGVAASNTGAVSTPSQQAGSGQMVFGLSYGESSAGLVTATTPGTGWTQSQMSAGGSTLIGMLHREPTATPEAHTFTSQRPSGTTYTSQFVLGDAPNRTNLFTYPNAEGVGIAWSAAVNTPSVALSSVQAWAGTQSYAMTTAATGSQEIVTPTGTAAFPVTQGLSYALSFYARADATGRQVTPKINWYNAAGTLLTTSTGTAPTDSNTAWVRASLVATAPANAAFASVQVRWSIGLSAFEVHYVDGFLLEQSTTVGTFFDGSTSLTGYTFAWTGTPQASTSTQTILPTSNNISSSFSGSGSLTTRLSDYINISSGFTGAGALSSRLSDYVNIDSAFSGSGSLTTKLPRHINSTFSGAGTLSTIVSTIRTIGSSFSGSGVLSGGVRKRIISGYSGSGTLTTALRVLTKLSSDFSGEGVLYTEIGYVVKPAELGTGPLGKRINYSVSTAAVPLNPAEGSGSATSVSATYLKGIDPEMALGERNVLSANNIGTYEGEIVNLSVNRASSNVTTSMSTPLSLLNNELNLFPFIDSAESKWTAARAIDYWTQQCGLFYDKVPGDCISYASAYGHTNAYGASTASHFYERLTGGTTATAVVNERSVRTFGDNVTATTAFHEDANASVAFTMVKNQKLIFSTGIGIRGTGRTATVGWILIDSKNHPHTMSISATSGGFLTVAVDGQTVSTATVAGNDDYRVTVSLEQLGSAMVGKLTVYNDDLAGHGSVVYAGNPTAISYQFPASLKLKRITNVSSGGSGEQMLRWGSYLTLDNAHPMGVPAIQKELLESTKARGFVSGFQGNVWNMLNEFCSIARLDVRYLDEKLTVGPRISTLTAPDGNFSQFTYNSERRDKYKQVAVRNLQSKVVTDDTAVLWRSDSVFQIAAREVMETTVQTDHSILSLVQPVAVTGITPFPYTKGGGQYVVTGADGYIISPAWWYDNGGKVEVSLTDKEGEIAIKITAPDLDTVRAPYRISEGEADRPALYISGSGILNTPKEVHVGTGAKNAKEGFDNVFESPFIAGVVETYDVAMAMASQYSVMNAEVEFEIPNDFDTPSRFGQFPAGAIFTDNVRNYRIQSASQTHSKVSGSAESHTTIGAFVASMPEGATLADLKARFFGATIRQFNIKPLRGTSV